MPRAIRRHHQDRYKAKARAVARDSWGIRPSLGWSQADALAAQKRAEKCANHLKACGGACCANPRHNGWYHGLGRQTVQERRAIDATHRDDGHALDDGDR